MSKNPSVITHSNVSPMVLFWVSIFFFAILEMLTYAKFGALITIIPDTLFLVFLLDSIATKIRNVRRNRNPNFHSNEDYDNLIHTLNQVKKGSASIEQKKHISIKLINTPGLLSEDDKKYLIEQTEQVYSSSE